MLQWMDFWPAAKPSLSAGCNIVVVTVDRIPQLLPPAAAAAVCPAAGRGGGLAR